MQQQVSTRLSTQIPGSERASTLTSCASRRASWRSSGSGSAAKAALWGDVAGAAGALPLPLGPAASSAAAAAAPDAAAAPLPEASGGSEAAAGLLLGPAAAGSDAPAPVACCCSCCCLGSSVCMAEGSPAAAGAAAAAAAAAPAALAAAASCCPCRSFCSRSPRTCSSSSNGRSSAVSSCSKRQPGCGEDRLRVKLPPTGRHPPDGQQQPHPAVTPALTSRHCSMCWSLRRQMGREGRPSSTSRHGCSSPAPGSSPTLDLPAQQQTPRRRAAGQEQPASCRARVCSGFRCCAPAAVAAAAAGAHPWGRGARRPRAPRASAP